GFVATGRRARLREVSIEEAAQADYALEEAHNGNFKPLIERVRQHTVLLPTEREIVAAIMAGKLRRRRGRLALPAARAAEQLILALDVLQRPGPLKTAVIDTAKKFEVSRSAVYGAVKKHAKLFGGPPSR